MNVVFVDAGTHLLARCSGVWDPVELTEVLKTMRANAIQSAHCKLMIDWTDVAAPSSDSFRVLAGEDAASHFPPPLRVGVLYRPLAINGIAESVATGLGADFRVLPDEVELLTWLLA